MRVLHVEDSPSDADLTRRQLTRLAPDIVLDQVSSVAAALDRLEQPMAYDLALVDLRLPDGSGLELLAHIRECELPMAVVMLTGSGDQDAAIAALRAGADDYQSKRGELSQLPATLQNALRHSAETRARWERPLRVLYAEHHQADIDLTRRYLARHAPHLILTVVKDATEALELLPSDTGTAAAFDVVLVDYLLPGLDALELSKVLRIERGLTIPIVLVSGHGSEAVAAQAWRLGVDAVLSKHDGYLYELVPTLEKVHHQAELEAERRTLQATSQRLADLLNASPVVLYTLQLDEKRDEVTWVSENIRQRLGYPVEAVCKPGWWSAHLHAEERDTVLANTLALGADEDVVQEYRLVGDDDQVIWIRDEQRLLSATPGQPREIAGTWQDITSQRQIEMLQQSRLAVLDSLVNQASLEEVLTGVAQRLEGICPPMRVSILLLDARSGRLHTGAAPSLPDDYNAMVDGLEPGVGQGSCGSAVALGEPVMVEDISTHPYWAPFVDVAAKAGLGACWSIPFRDDKGTVLGTFGVYYTQPRRPDEAEIKLIEEFSRLTSLAVTRLHADTAMRQAAAVFESTSEGVMITDLTPHIIDVNRAFSEVTGYAEEDVVGRNPSLLQSGRHDEAFYQSMWASIKETGGWQGEIWNRRKDGELFPQLLTISSVYDDQGLPTHYVGLTTDISYIKQSEQRLERLAHYDPLTGLPNRLLFNARLEHALEQAARCQAQVALMFLDLDRFKQINDSLGHPVGDELLKGVAERLGHCVRINDTVARVGGDEFIILLENVKQPDHAAVVAEKVLLGFTDPFDLVGRELYITPSIGICLYPRDGADAETLLRNADTAMYAAKNHGHNAYAFYSEQLTSHALEQVMLENSLRKALLRDELRLHFQPQRDMAAGNHVGLEALVRWEHPDLGLVSPARFIPLAEETGLIVDIGAWVLQSACAQAKAWLDQGLEIGRMAVNVAGAQIKRGVILQQVEAALASSGLPADRLELEVTEGFIMDEADVAIEILTALRALGVSLSIDDFGTGYSSLAYLKRLPINQLKIDQSFVRDIPADADDMAIIKAVIALGKSLSLDVIAEGVETEEQMRFLIENGCSKGQGYLFSRPQPADALEKILNGQA